MTSDELIAAVEARGFDGVRYIRQNSDHMGFLPGVAIEAYKGGEVFRAGAKVKAEGIAAAHKAVADWFSQK